MQVSKNTFIWIPFHEISQLDSVRCVDIFPHSCSSGVASLGACHPPPSSADDHSESLHDRPGDWAVDQILPQGWRSSHC